MIYPADLLWLAAVLAAAKILHELGHAVTCSPRRPMPRTGADAARVYAVPLLRGVRRLDLSRQVATDRGFRRGDHRRNPTRLAGRARVVLQRARAGPRVSFYVMVVCSVSTLLFNGNPLLRYDGYYVLADLVEVPNLAEQSRACWSAPRPCSFWEFAGPMIGCGRQGEDSCLGYMDWPRWPTAASSSARLSLLSIAYRPAHGEAVLGDAFASLVLAGLVLPAAWRFAAFLKVQRFAHRGSWPRTMAIGGFWSAVLLCLVLVPWPCRVTASRGRRTRRRPSCLRGRRRHVSGFRPRGRPRGQGPGSGAAGQFGHPPGNRGDVRAAATSNNASLPFSRHSKLLTPTPPR